MPNGLRRALSSVVSIAAFAGAFYLRMDLAYGPFNLGLRPADWMVLWELFLYGQMSTRVLLESAVAGVVAGALPWLLAAVLRRRA